VRKVVDSNFLQTDELRKYLLKGVQNTVVLSDYAAMEAYKGETLASIFNSMRVLSEFPDQVVVLKSTQIVCSLSGHPAGLQKRLIDSSQTKGFNKYCKLLKQAQTGDNRHVHVLQEYGEEATRHLDLVQSDAERIPATISVISKTYSQSELRSLRTGKPLAQQTVDKILSSILQLAAFMFRDHPKVHKLPEYKYLSNTFIFRYALCVYLLSLDWISKGGAKGVKSATMRNDLVDMSYAAYATFFDGLLSADKKANRIYRSAHSLICTVFQDRPMA